MNKISNVTVLGSGVLGSQIAFQAAYANFNVTVYDINDDAIVKAQEYYSFLSGLYKKDKHVSDEEIESTLERLLMTTDLKEAVENADLVIEAIPEVLELKKEIFTKIGNIAPAKTIFATNTSMLLPSEIMDYTGRPEKFLALHFATLLYKYNVAEVMATPKTSPEIYSTVVNFAREMGMEPIEIKKEQSGYILNTLLMPFLTAAAQLLMKGVADAETIDKTWRISLGAPVGPFEIYDAVGLNTLYNISMLGDANSKMFAYYLKINYINKGKLGVATGEGFHKYPDRFMD